MALSQEDRISISKAFVSAPAEKAQIAQNKVQIELSKVEIQKKDTANKGLVDAQTALIDPYQSEIVIKNGVIRTVLTEQMQIDAADRKIGNFFFPNEQSVPLPSVPDGIWKYFSPFFGSYGIGKQKLETYGSTTPHEQSIITDINAQIAILESFPLIQRTTGQSCEESGTCSIPMHTTEAACLLNGGVWTPGPDVIANLASIQTAMSTLLSKISNWQTNLNSTTSALSAIAAVDLDSARITTKNTEQTSVTNTLSAITTWLAYPDFNTAHGQTTCAGFNAYNASLLAPTKAYTTQLNTLKAAITARSSQITTRLGEVTGYLGGVTQDPSSGDITGGSGFYLSRAKAMNLRLHAMGGSLSALKGADKSIAALDQFSKNKDDAVAVYQTAMVATLLRAPANGTDKIHVKDATNFAVGNQIFIITDSQPELSRTIQAISGTMFTLDQPVSQIYKESGFGRVYKLL